MKYIKFVKYILYVLCLSLFVAAIFLSVGADEYSINLIKPQSPKDLSLQKLDIDTLSKPDQNKHWAVLIGIEDYEDPSIRDLKYSIDDVKSVYKVLVDPNKGGFAPQNIRLLTDDFQDINLKPTETLKPTRLNILDSLQNWLRDTQSDDILLFYFSGHGIADKGGKNYLVPIDAKPGLLQDSAISMQRVNEILNDKELIPAQKIVVVLDSCHSGTRIDAKAMETGRILDPLFTNAEGRVTLASCSADEQSYEDHEKGHGIFTYFMVEGLNGDGDLDSDGLISTDEIGKYVFQKVKDWSRVKQKQQTPRKEANVAGEIWLSRNPERLVEVRKQRQKDKLTNLFGSGNISSNHYNEAISLLDKDPNSLSESEGSILLILRDFLDGGIIFEQYRKAIYELKELGIFEVRSEPSGAKISINGEGKSSYTIYLHRNALGQI